MPHGGHNRMQQDMSLYGLEDYTLVRHIMVKRIKDHLLFRKIVKK